MGILDALLIVILTTAFVVMIVGTSSLMYLKLKLYERNAFALDLARSVAMTTTDFETNTQAHDYIINLTQILMPKLAGNREPHTQISFDTINGQRAIVIKSTISNVPLFGDFVVPTVTDTATCIYKRTVGFCGFECKQYNATVPGHRGNQPIAWVPIVEAPPVGSHLAGQSWWLECPRQLAFNSIASDHHEPPCQTFYIRGRRIHYDVPCQTTNFGVAGRTNEHVLPGDSGPSDQTTTPFTGR